MLGLRKGPVHRKVLWVLQTNMNLKEERMKGRNEEREGKKERERNGEFCVPPSFCLTYRSGVQLLGE